MENLSKTFMTRNHEVRALDDVTLSVDAGECMAIVGESGSGKSTIANILLGIYPASAGRVVYKGRELPARRTLADRRDIQLVQQNPLSSLNPLRSIGASLRLPLDVHAIGERAGRPARVAECLEEVGLPADFAGRRPSSLSGGQRQRVAIARALATNPGLVVLDEPTSALDVLVQARVLRLLDDLRRRHGLTYVFITHDLSVVRNIATRVAVFERGRLVELNDTEKLFTRPDHPYTQRLIGAVPVVTEAEAQMRATLIGAAHASS
jgi:ABC-type glutathione transport system ATPase component